MQNVPFLLKCGCYISYF